MNFYTTISRPIDQNEWHRSFQEMSHGELLDHLPM